MSWLFPRSHHVDREAVLATLDKAQAVAEFGIDGSVLAANRNFLDLLGYDFSEVAGRDHRLFVERVVGESAEYAARWAKLCQGEPWSASVTRLTKDGRPLQWDVRYIPVRDAAGPVAKVMMYATDLTAVKQECADLRGRLAAVDASLSMCEFALDGTILAANANFLKTMGYTLDEIRGRHHSMFVSPSDRSSPAYTAFWETLRHGDGRQARFKRIAKGGREVWIEGSYNPVRDRTGRPFKVIKLAFDVTAEEALLRNLKTLIDVNFAEVDSAMASSIRQSETAAAATLETTDDVRAVAASTEQMTASIREISASVANSRNVAASAFEQVAMVGLATKRLTDTATAMGSVVGMIREIAAQINLLALNATIEAARAGEAGRGFAVVAGEIENLASQAAHATRDIGEEIEGVQAVSGEVAEALGGIHQAIDSLRDDTTATTAAIERQSAAAEEASRTMQNASVAVATISTNIAGITAAVRQVEAAVAKTRKAAEVLTA